jgi:uncharacterized protein
VSPDNVEIVRRFYDTVAHGESLADLLGPDVEYVNPAGAIEPGVRRGIGAFNAAVEHMFEGWGSWQGQPERLTSFGDHVAVVVRYRARGRASGAEVEGCESALFTIRGEKIVRYEWFQDPEDAEAAARHVTRGTAEDAT